MKIPFVDLTAQYQSIKRDIDNAISRVIGDTAFVGGKYVELFEKQFAAAYGVKYAIACGNGTDSLYIIMRMLEIGLGDEVITVANSWISSSETITQTGAKPIFIDVHPEYYSLDEELLESKITPKTRAVIAVHLQGQSCAIESVKSICDKHGLHLIEDCAQAHFSEYNGKKVGLFGIASSFSFYPGKNLGAYGDAGCIISNDDVLANKMKMFARHGALKKHEHRMEGINSRMDGLQASILSVKLPHILKWTEKRIWVAYRYTTLLAGLSGIVTPKVRPNCKHTYHLYVIRAERRNELMKYLFDNQIESSIHYPRILPSLEAYSYLNHTASDFPIASRHQNEILSLPIFPEMTEEMIAYVVEKIKSFYKD